MFNHGIDFFFNKKPHKYSRKAMTHISDNETLFMLTVSYCRSFNDLELLKNMIG